MAINAQTWLNNYLTNLSLDKTNVTEIYGTTTTTGSATPSSPYELLTGELIIEDYPNLEVLDLSCVNELDKLTISNCPKLKEILIENSGIKELELGSGLDGVLLLDFGFEVTGHASGRITSRKLVELDLSNVPNLKVLRCFGIQETKLTGVEYFKQLQQFDSGDDTDDTEVVVFPTDKFREWKESLAAITVTDPNHLDLLKDSGPDKGKVDPDKLKNYKQKTNDYNRIYAKLGGEVSNSYLDNLLNSYGSGLQSQLDQAKQEAVSKLLASIVTELQLQLKEDITKEKVLEKIKELIDKPSSTAEKDAEIKRLKKEINAKNNRITELESPRGKIIENMKQWGVFSAAVNEKELMTVSSTKFEEMRNELTELEFTRLKKSRDNAYYLNIALAILSVGILLVLIWKTIKEVKLTLPIKEEQKKIKK